MMPQYVSVYRVTHWNNCYDGNINLKMFGGSIVRETKYNIEQGNIPPQTDYIGISLLDINMNIVIDTTVNLRTIVTSSTTSKPKKKNPKKKKKKKNDRILFPMYNDYRLFNLNDNNGNDDQLYLTTMNHIAPIELSLLVTATTTTATATATLLKQQQQPQPPIGYIEIPNAFNVNDVNNKTATASSNTTATSNTTAATASNPATATTNPVSLQVFIRNYSSCPIGKTINKRKQSSKNLLYFQNNGNENDNTNSSSNTNTNTNTKLLVQPRWNPNEVLDNVDLNLICKPNKDTKTKYSINIDEQVKQAKEGYQTIEKLLYPSYTNNDLFVDDRGSACCTEIYMNMNNTNSANNMNTNTNTTKSENEEHDDQQQQRKQLPNQKLKVAVVHPKTKYPGKNLPIGIKSNMYLSRFIAFLPEYPYTIIYKSGMFCLGYPATDNMDNKENQNKQNDNDNDNDNGSNQNPLTYMKMIPLEFGINNNTNTNINETETETETESTYYYNYNCPRIHFVTGMIDKVEVDKVNNVNNNANNNNNNDGSVILSYGVSDCLSRFIEIKKSEIIRMLF
jgi:hypothetical protein